MYKRQLRGMPEAIVKDPMMRQRGRRDHYWEGSEGSGGGAHDWKNGSGEEGEDWDEDWRRREKREKLVEQEAVEVMMRQLGLVLPSSSEDDALLAAGSGNDLRACAKKRGKKRKRMVKTRKFPMAVGPEGTTVRYMFFLEFSFPHNRR